jgi:hypothetical protein
MAAGLRRSETSIVELKIELIPGVLRLDPKA